MAKPFDATLNAMIDLGPEDWAATFARIAGIPPGPSTALDTDLANSLQADKIFRIDGSSPAVLHLELEANPRLGIPRDLMRYNTLIDHQHGLPVTSLLILLRPKALASDQTGCYQRHDANGALIAEFHYRVVKVWEQPVEYWLRSGMTLAPLALLTNEASLDLDSALDRFRENLRTTRVEQTIAESLIGSTYVLCGLRYQRDRVAELFRRLSMLMEESTTYQAILEEGRTKGISQGRTEGLRSVILRQGLKRFGQAPVGVSEVLQSSDPYRLELLAEKILDASSWENWLDDVR